MDIEMYFMGIDDHYVPQGKINELLKEEHFDIEHLYLKLKEISNEEREN